MAETTADLRFLMELSISEFGKETFTRLFPSSVCTFFTTLLFTLVGSGHDASMQSEQDESLMSKEVLCVSEYAEDIHLHLREREVRNYLNYEHVLLHSPL